MNDMHVSHFVMCVCIRSYTGNPPRLFSVYSCIMTCYTILAGFVVFVGGYASSKYNYYECDNGGSVARAHHTSVSNDVRTRVSDRRLLITGVCTRFIPPAPLATSRPVVSSCVGRSDDVGRNFIDEGRSRNFESDTFTQNARFFNHHTHRHRRSWP